jgi:hypothetical protein
MGDVCGGDCGEPECGDSGLDEHPSGPGGYGACNSTGVGTANEADHGGNHDEFVDGGQTLLSTSVDQLGRVGN